jgi:hypothetical protein
MSDLQDLLKKEPWRSGQGQPDNPLSQGWDGEERPPCPAEDIEWEGKGPYWACRTCGYIGSASVQQHRRVQFPSEFLEKSIRLFLRERSKRGLSFETAVGQLLYIMAVAVRNAVEVLPDNLARYVAQFVSR